MRRIIGLYNVKTGEWNKFAYLHSNAGGESCVNGEQGRIALHRAGETMPLDADYAIVLPRSERVGEERFVAVNGGECLLWYDGGVSVVNAGFVEVSAPFELWRKIRAGVLTISDKGARGERLDTAGPALVSMMEALGSAVVRRDIVPDDRDKIAATLMEWADEDKLQVILTTGGTGLSKRDVTPEALMDVQHKLVPGFGETMRARSMLYTERGFLTRSFAVVRDETLIVAFPGSERAVRQCFEAIAGSLRHGIEILSGWDAECGGHNH
jgi:molybdenum cofactor synthesis domain-containing protein